MVKLINSTDSWNKMKNPIRLIRHKLKEHLFFRNKRGLFEVNLENIYDDSQFQDRKRDEYFEYGSALEGVFLNSSFMDIGCANGHLLDYFYQKGIKDIAGIEGSEAAFKYMPEHIKCYVSKADLSRVIGISAEKYDLVNCTEVGEHIPFKYENIFLKNVTGFVGKYLVLSWADTWEGWHGMEKQEHVNPRSKGYVIKKLKAMGLDFNKKLTDELVKNLSTRKVHDHWIKRVMVFEK